MRRFFRFTVRDLLWLTLVVAAGLGWFVHQRQLRGKAAQALEQMTTWQQRAGSLECCLANDGWQMSWISTRPWVHMWKERNGFREYRMDYFDITLEDD